MIFALDVAVAPMVIGSLAIFFGIAAAIALAVVLIVVGCKRHKKKKTAAQEAVKNKEADSL